MNKVYQCVQTKELDRTKRECREPDNKKITVPGQAVSIKELMDRYEKGRPEPEGD